MDTKNESISLLELTKGQICMYDIFKSCNKPQCNKEHIQDLKLRNFIGTLTRNALDSSIIKKLPFYLNDSKYITNEDEMNKHIEAKGITDKADIKYEMSNKIKRDILRMSNQIGNFGENKKTSLGLCSKHLFMSFCNNYKSGNYITIDVKYPDGEVGEIDLCYSDKHFLSICNCNINMVKSKKTGRYYMTNIRKINKSIKESLFDYSSKSNPQDEYFCKPVNETNVKKETFKMEKKSFPTMDGKETELIKPTVWVKKPLEEEDDLHRELKRFSPVSPLTIDSNLRKMGTQREISTSSLSEMSSPVQFEIKEFETFLKKDLTKIKSRSEFITIIQGIQSEFNKARELAICYYEKLQRNVIVSETNELRYNKIITELKGKLELKNKEEFYSSEEHQDEILYSDEYLSSDKSDGSLSDDSLIDDFYE
jgi:hypothetical protein